MVWRIVAQPTGGTMADREDDIEMIRRRNALLGADFRAARLARKWRSQTIACRRTGLKRGVISKIEQGDPARLCHYQAYAHALGMRLGLVPDEGTDEGSPPDVESLATAVATRAMSVIMEMDRYREDPVNVDRRQLIVSLAALLVGSGVPRSLRQLFLERNFPISSVDDVEALASDCGRYLLDQCATAGGGAVCDVSLAMYQQVGSWLEHGTHTGSMQQSLEHLRCELGAWVGWLMLDAGRLGPAERHLEKTLVQARLAGSSIAEAHALDSVCTLLKRRGQLTRSRQAAELGLRVAEGTGSPRMRAQFHLRIAKASGRLGDTASFGTHAAAAKEALAASADTRSPLWLEFLTTGAYDLGDGLFALGQAGQAAEAFRSIARAPETNHHRDVVHAMVREAQALAMMGDAGAAAEGGLLALSRAGAVDSALIRGDLRALRGTLSRQAGTPLARHFVSAYDELTPAIA